jgi:hypothetical protein
VIQETRVAGDTLGNLVIKVDFAGSFNGTAYFTGKPYYNIDKNAIEVESLDYDIKTKSLFLKTAKWLFNKKIETELKQYTSFNLSAYYDTATATLNTWLNKEWTKGISGAGKISDLKLTSVFAQPQHLLIRSNCTGNLAVKVSEIDLNF